MSEHCFDDGPCPRCQFERRPLPSWAKAGAIFALEGQTWRVVACGSSNRATYPHFSDTILVEPLTDQPWAGLPSAPCPIADLAASLHAVFGLKTFGVADLDAALRAVA